MKEINGVHHIIYDLKFKKNFKGRTWKTKKSLQVTCNLEGSKVPKVFRFSNQNVLGVDVKDAVMLT